MKNKIDAFYTHYKIYDYHKGDCFQLERDLSTYDEIYHKYDNKYYIDEENHILYVPRGYDPLLLQDYFKRGIGTPKNNVNVQKSIFTMRVSPRDDIQRESIRFLLGKDEFKRTLKASQLVFSLDPGVGKTYCCIAAISLMGCKSLIIVPNDELRNHWVDKFKTFTTLGAPNIVKLEGTTQLNKLLESSERKLVNKHVFITTHATISSYIKREGKEALDELINHLGIGVKVIDEAHLYFDSTLNIDYFTNVPKTFYVTATFGRSDFKEDNIFQNSFKCIDKFIRHNEENYNHTVYLSVLFNSNPSHLDQIRIKGAKGFDANAYISYQLNNHKLKDYIIEIMDMFVKKDVQGKILILSSQKQSCDTIRDLLIDNYPHKKICSHHSGNKQTDLSEFDVICATSKMLGTGFDLPGMRAVINTEQASSKINLPQIKGRLRKYAEGRDTYYVEITDKGFPNVARMYSVRQKIIKPLVKKVLILDKTIKR